jgi:hypothetical protein
VIEQSNTITVWKYINSFNIQKQIEHMSNDDTEEEKFFRERYAQELQKKNRQPGAGSYSQGDEMAEERRNVSLQQGKTPGRRGEEIKQEEINKEIVRRNRLQQKKKKSEKQNAN